jgi:hypothetical protein
VNSPDGLPRELLDAVVEMMGRAGRLGSVRVLGRSMEPTLGSGDLLAVDFAAGELLAGDLLVFRQSDYLTVHRLLGSARDPEGRPCLRTRGDGAMALDPPLARQRVVGRVVAARRGGVWRDLRGKGARRYARALAWHDLAWAAVGLAAYRTADRVFRRLGLGTPARRLAAAADRVLIGAADRLLFDRLHREVEAPEGASDGDETPQASASAPSTGLLY